MTPRKKKIESCTSEKGFCYDKINNKLNKKVQSSYSKNYNHNNSFEVSMKNKNGIDTKINVEKDENAFGKSIEEGEFKAFKFRLYPNRTQREILHKTFGCKRFIWNKMLGERKKVYKRLQYDKTALYSHQYKTEKQYKNDFPFLRDVDSITLQQSRIDLLMAYKNFFEGLNTNRNVGFPKFKSRKNKQTFRTINVNDNIRIDFHLKCIKLPKIKMWIKYRDNRIFNESIRSVTVSKTKSGKYYASFLLKNILPPRIEQIKESNIEAFDMSASKFLVGQNVNFNNPRFYRAELARLRRFHRNLSRKKMGSYNREKARLYLARQYDKITNRRKDWTHKVSLELAKKHDAIILENLNIQAMQQFNTGLAKSISLDFSWNLFKTIIKYKLKWHGKHYLEVDRFYPSSKLCSICGYKNINLKLSERQWICPNCKSQHDRDKNASNNLKMEGIRLLRDKGINITSYS